MKNIRRVGYLLLLLCVAFAVGGYYLGQRSKPVSQAEVKRGEADRAQFTRNPIEVKAYLTDVLDSTDALPDLNRIARKFLPASPAHTSQPQCPTDADEAISLLKDDMCSLTTNAEIVKR